MKPETSHGPEYDKGFSDGYHFRGVEQLLLDLRSCGNLTPEDVIYIEETAKRHPKTAQKVLAMLQ
jgi:hypothetical protein